jgi:hypothetical protein
MFEKYANIKFQENPSTGSRAVPCGRADGKTGLTKTTVAFRKRRQQSLFADEDNSRFSQTKTTVAFRRRRQQSLFANEDNSRFSQTKTTVAFRRRRQQSLFANEDNSRFSQTKTTVAFRNCAYALHCILWSVSSLYCIPVSFKSMHKSHFDIAWKPVVLSLLRRMSNMKGSLGHNN